jgi:hypothetical protein
MNNIQYALRDLIHDTLKNIQKHKAGEIVNWTLRNLIAKYSLANDYYYTTQKTFDFIKQQGLEISNRAIKIKKNQITFEHPVPSKVIADEFIKKYDPDYINKILEDTDAVVILSHGEDDILKKNGLNSIMPTNWNFGDNIFARYDYCKIKVLEEKIKMKGAIRR